MKIKGSLFTCSRTYNVHSVPEIFGSDESGGMMEYIFIDMISLFVVGQHR